VKEKRNTHTLRWGSASVDNFDDLGLTAILTFKFIFNIQIYLELVIKYFSHSMVLNLGFISQIEEFFKSSVYTSKSKFYYRQFDA
jgi:hypothetical protein